MRVLVVEDKLRMASLLERALLRAGYQVSVAQDGERALRVIEEQVVDLMVLDVMLSQLDGFEVLARLRQEQNYIPTILLTARDSNEDIVRGLDLGADDYLVKPFQLEVLLARVRALSRRRLKTEVTAARFGDLVLMPHRQSLQHKLDGRETVLTRTEFTLLEVLVRNAGRIVTKETLGENCWGLNADSNDAGLYVFISAVRQKMQALGSQAHIQAVRGVGYILQQVGE